MNVVLFSPSSRSLYSLCTAESLARLPGLNIIAVIVRRILNVERLRTEWKRDGQRLVSKVWHKLVRDNSDLRCGAPASATLVGVAADLGLTDRTLPSWAARRRIPVSFVDSFSSSSSVSALQDAHADVAVFTGGGLLSTACLQCFRHGVVNAHAGILPFFRGMDVVEWPMLWPEVSRCETGVTIHLMDAGVDTGPILALYRMGIQPEEGFEVFRSRLGPLQVRGLTRAMEELRDGSSKPKVQIAEAGRQFFVMHPRLRKIAAERLTRRLPCLRAAPGTEVT